MLTDDGIRTNIKDLRIEIGDNVIVYLAVKVIDGKEFLDIRKWYKYGNLTEYFPSKKGLMLQFSDWNRIIDGIKSLSTIYKEGDDIDGVSGEWGAGNK